MRKKVCWFSTFLLMFTWSCTKVGFPGNQEEGGSPGEESRPVENVVYVTGIGYPDDYDWRNGGPGQAKSHLIVLRNGVEFLHLPVGDEFYLSPEPDMHRFIGGKLYADFTTGSETIITANGKELFRYGGNEMMSGFLVQGEDVYTLGADRDGRGLSLRVNGEVLFEDPEGVPSGDLGQCLYMDGKDLCFVYRKKYSDSSYDLGPWYVFSHGQAAKVAMREDVSEIFAVRMVHGEVCSLVTFEGKESSPMLLWGKHTFALCKIPDKENLYSGKIFASGDHVFVKADFSSKYIGRTILWTNTDADYVYDGYLPLYNIYVDGAECTYLVDMLHRLTIHTPYGINEDIDRDCHLISPACVNLTDGVTRMGLTSSDYKKHPSLWTDGKMRDLPFSGFVTSVVVESEVVSPPMRPF